MKKIVIVLAIVNLFWVLISSATYQKQGLSNEYTQVTTNSAQLIKKSSNSTDLLKYRISEKQDVSYPGTPRMVYRVIIDISQLPTENQMRELAKSLWNDGNTHWVEFTVFLYLPNMNTNSVAYGRAEFRQTGLKEFEVQSIALEINKK